MKVIEFPKDEKDITKEISDFMDKVKEILIEEGVTNVVISAKDEDGEGGTSVYARSRADAIELLWDSLQNI
jgi:hypothetical protein